MSGIHVGRQGFVTKSAPPSLSRQRGPVAYACSLLINGNGPDGAAAPASPKELVAGKYLQRALTPQLVNSTPYWPDGQWSNYFSGTTQAFAAQPNAAFLFGTGDFTIELWAYIAGNSALDGGNARRATVFAVGSGVNSGISFTIEGNSTTTGTGLSLFRNINTQTGIAVTGTVPQNAWNHIAVCRSGTSLRFFLNGTQMGSTITDSGIWGSSTYTPFVGGNPNNGSYTQYTNGYLSNFRVVNGSALYTSNFTPSTTPLTAVSGTSLLTCQSNRFKDNSSNNFAITVTGAPTVQSIAPFTPPASPRSYGGSVYQTGSIRAALYTDPVPIATGEFCIEFWCYPENFSSARKLVSNRAWNTGYSKGWGTDVSTTGKVSISASTGAWNNWPAFITSTNSLIAGAWNHVAITRDSSNLVRIFINGVQDPTTVTYSASLDLFVSGFGTHYFAIGNEFADGNFQNASFGGNISNVRIGTGTGSAIYTSAFTPPTGALTPTTGTVFLARCDAPYVVESGDYNRILTPVGGVGQSAVSPFGATYPGSLTFDGVSQTALLANSDPAYNLGTNNFTIEGWIRTTSTTVDRGVFGRVSSGSGRISLTVSPSQGLWFWSSEVNSGSSPACANTTVVTDGNWHHFAVVRNGNVFTLYIDGVAGGTTTTTSNALASVVVPLYIGNDPSNLSSRPWLGGITNLRIVNGTALYTSNFTPSTTPLTAVSGTALLLLGNNLGIGDNSANAYTINVFGDAQISTTQSKFGGSSIKLDGTGDYFTVANNTPLQFSVPLFNLECWVYRSASGVVHTIAAKGASTSGWLLQINASDKLTFTINTSVVMTSTSSIPANTWTHVAVTRDGANQMRMFINGVQEATTSNSTTFSQTEVLTIGADRSNTNFFNGYIEDFRIFRDGVKYIAAFTAPTTELSATDDCFRFFTNTVYGVYQAG